MQPVPPAEPVQPEAPEEEAPAEVQTAAADAQPAAAPVQGEDTDGFTPTQQIVPNMKLPYII